VLMDVGSHTMQLIVPDDKLSLAIGKKGQNVRLASQLSGWRIDIHSEGKVREMETRAKASLAAIEGVGTELADALFKMGFRSATEVARAGADELAALPGVGSTAAANQILGAAAKAAEIEEKRRAEERARAEAEAAAALAHEEEPSGSSGAPVGAHPEDRV
jgi:transcription termination/antitermination protein NusA